MNDDIKEFEPDTEYARRVMNAYYKRSKSVRMGESPQCPSNNSPVGFTVDGEDYFVLFNSQDILAVYLLQPDDTLKRLSQWPKAIDDEFHQEFPDALDVAL